jgi:hypothetical protein
VAPHYATQAPPGSLFRRGSPRRATGSGVASFTAAPPWMARLKRVSQMKYFHNKFIFKNCFKFRFVLSKLPQVGGKSRSEKKIAANTGLCDKHLHLGIKIERKRTELSGATFILIFLYESKYKNIGNK